MFVELVAVLELSIEPIWNIVAVCGEDQVSIDLPAKPWPRALTSCLPEMVGGNDTALRALIREQLVKEGPEN